VKRFGKAKQIKVGVVGYGGAFNMGRAHLEQMKKAGMTPVAVADTDAARLKIAQTDFPGIETYPSLTEMLATSDVNLITLITPHNTHCKLAVEALQAGRHVVVEKPMAITTDECDAMIAAAEANDVMLSTYHNRHWDGCILRAVTKISSGLIGEILHIEIVRSGYGAPRAWWRSSKSLSGGILYDWGVHLLEYSLQLLTANLVEVSGFSRSGIWAPTSPWKDDTNEDEAYALVRFDTGQWLSLFMSNVDLTGRRSGITVTGTMGTYIFDGRTWEHIRADGDDTMITRGANPEGEGWRYYQNVADHLAKGAPLVITAQWARRPIHIIDLAMQSAAQGRTLQAKYK